jgi:tRNA(Leu) C34 or U34 (ribose-2'-O)-methylase TrmL
MTGILLLDPKYPHNVGSIVRAAACYGVAQVWWTGDRVSSALAVTGEGVGTNSTLGRGSTIPKRVGRLPREERLRDYQAVDWRQLTSARPFDRIPSGMTPVAVEFDQGAEKLPDFEHPEHAFYVFGPEDGSMSRSARMQCHRHVLIPTAHCLNLAVAVATVLYDRMAKGYH